MLYMTNSSNTYVMWTSKTKITFGNNIYANLTSSSNDDDSLNTWYRRLGHFSINGLKDSLPKVDN